ncbi:MAG: imidazoleglycerol-phosphate dehydratase HisB [Erysipelotrichia bacterium]|nr:imidazoleglycerol-phosphate dehydratase HisB [Erysipelotrichia bacterium]NCC54316.1 imidazoleglycerol-phosphate dehydratase HisB [Erysipelotrichia bacterium]
MKRVAQAKRDSKETQIEMAIHLDGEGKSEIDTGVGFFDHMLTLFAFHAKIDLIVKAKGDLEVCDHHLVEDTGILLGTLLLEALGDKRGIERYGNARVPMDEVLTCVDLDLSGRSYLVYHCDLKRDTIGAYSCEMTSEFLRAFANNAKMTLHVNCLYGENDHHKVESIFKALGRALKQAIQQSGNRIPSTKGII